LSFRMYVCQMKIGGAQDDYYDDGDEDYD
jgi:hypothetical protein